MIHCYIALCLITNPGVCDPKKEIAPAASPDQCGRNAAAYFAMSPDPLKAPRVWAELADPSVTLWIAEQKRRASAR